MMDHLSLKILMRNIPQLLLTFLAMQMCSLFSTLWKFTLFQKTTTIFFLHVPSSPPEPITVNGQQEFFIDKIVDERKDEHKTLYHIQWQGEGPEGDLWLPIEELADCKALDTWINHRQRVPGALTLIDNFKCTGQSLFPMGFLTHPH